MSKINNGESAVTSLVSS